MCVLKKVSLHYPAILRARQGHFALDKVKSQTSTQAKEAIKFIQIELTPIQFSKLCPHYNHSATC